MLRIENLQVKYGDFTAVESASLEVPEGEIVSLIGANGAGKSSLLNAAAGILKPESGRVFFAGKDITGKEASEIVKMGLSLVPQGGRCFDRMSVQDNLLMGSYPKQARGKARERMEWIYSLFPVLAEKRKEMAGTLSGGQRQMTAIGRALMSGPRCILFDEISLGLAPVIIREIYACIRKINEEGRVTVVLVEQDTERTLQISDRFYVMLKGNVVLSGKSSEVPAEKIRQVYFGV